MDTPAELIDLAREDLQSALDCAAWSAVGAPDACQLSLARSAMRFEAALTQLTDHPASRGREARSAFGRFRAALRAGAALHQNAGRLCAEWGRALQGPGGQAYAPASRGALPPLPSGGGRISVAG